MSQKVKILLLGVLIVLLGIVVLSIRAKFFLKQDTNKNKHNFESISEVFGDASKDISKVFDSTKKSLSNFQNKIAEISKDLQPQLNQEEKQVLEEKLLKNIKDNQSGVLLKELLRFQESIPEGWNMDIKEGGGSLSIQPIARVELVNNFFCNVCLDDIDITPHDQSSCSHTSSVPQKFHLALYDISDKESIEKEISQSKEFFSNKQCKPSIFYTTGSLLFVDACVNYWLCGDSSIIAESIKTHFQDYAP